MCTIVNEMSVNTGKSVGWEAVGQIQSEGIYVNISNNLVDCKLGLNNIYLV